MKSATMLFRGIWKNTLTYNYIRACENIFKMVVDHGDLQIRKSNPINQLHQIGLYLAELQDIVKGRAKT